MAGNPFVGVCYSRPPFSKSVGEYPLAEGVALIRSLGIGKVRLLSPDWRLLQSLGGTGIQVNLGIPNADLHDLALYPTKVGLWFSENINPYLSSTNFQYITVGESILEEERRRHLVLPAMHNIYNELCSQCPQHKIKVCTSMGVNVLGKWTHPSKANFQDQLTPFLDPIFNFLAESGSPLMVNIFPYRKYMKKDALMKSSPYGDDMDHSNAFTSDVPEGYSNSFDAMVDAFYCAMEKMGYQSIPLVVSSTGWPSDGGDPNVTNIANAQSYNQELIRHLSKGIGTPKKSTTPVTAYLCSLFKHRKVDNLHFSFFDFDMSPVYHLNFFPEPQ